MSTSITTLEDCIYCLFGFRNATSLVNGRIILNENSQEENLALEKYAFSNAMALSGEIHTAYFSMHYCLCLVWMNFKMIIEDTSNLIITLVITLKNVNLTKLPVIFAILIGCWIFFLLWYLGIPLRFI